MIPNGSDHIIRRALTYMPAEKVGQWARTMICPNITDRDIRRLQGGMPKPRPRTDRDGDHRFHHHGPANEIRDNGEMAPRIEALIARRAKECGVHPDFYRRALGWR